MTKIKICGIMTPHDVEIVNDVHPDFAGFVFAKGRHQITVKRARYLRKKIDSSIPVIGVFVNQSVKFVKYLFQHKIIQIAQLHGHESENYIQQLNSLSIPTIQVFKPEHQQVTSTSANYYMVDSGNGSGKTLNWKNLKLLNRHRMFVAGGITPKNEQQVIDTLHPYSLDVSSGSEVNGHKDYKLVYQLVSIAHAN